MTSLYRVGFAPCVDRQIDRLRSYVAADGGKRRADAYIARIIKACLSLKTFPERGRRRDDLHPHLRIMGYGKRVIIAFTIDQPGAQVFIEGIFYGGQDYESALRDADIN